MKYKWAWTALFTLPALASSYITGLLYRSADDGRWLFAVFTGFFSILMCVPYMRKSRQKDVQPIPTTRFAAAWVLPFYVTLFGGLLVLAALVGLHHS